MSEYAHNTTDHRNQALERMQHPSGAKDQQKPSKEDNAGDILENLLILAGGAGFFLWLFWSTLFFQSPDVTAFAKAITLLVEALPLCIIGYYFFPQLDRFRLSLLTPEKREEELAKRAATRGHQEQKQEADDPQDPATSSRSLVVQPAPKLPELLMADLPSLLTIRQDGVYFNDGGSPASLRELMTHIKDNWGATATLRCFANGTEGASRKFRIAVRAYADAFGIKMKDQHEQYKYLALTKNERGRLRELSDAIRDHHDDAPAYPALIRRFGLIWKSCVLLTLFFIAFGFAVPLEYMSIAIQWPFLPMHFQWICAGLFFTLGSFWLLHYFLTSGLFVNQYGPPLPPKSAETAPQRRKTGGVYGSAGAAEDYEIDAALQGHMGGFAPIFEE